MKSMYTVYELSLGTVFTYSQLSDC